jgi:Leucine-rich repeat (LRR) protein
VKHLSLHFNALSSLPAGIAGCEGLVWLSLNANRLTGLPEEICSMTALVRLSLHINQVCIAPLLIFTFKMRSSK